jgi:hypothetical protein
MRGITPFTLAADNRSFEAGRRFRKGSLPDVGAPVDGRHSTAKRPRGSGGARPYCRRGGAAKNAVLVTTRGNGQLHNKVIAVAFAAVILGGCGVAQLIASAL